MSILKTRGESEGVFKWTDNNSSDTESSSLDEIFEVLSKGLSAGAGEKTSLDEILETLKGSLADIVSSKNKDSLQAEVMRNQYGDVIRLRIYRVNPDGGAEENIFFTDRQTLLNQGASISKLYDVVKESGISLIEKDI